MTNNDLLRRIRYIFDFDNKKMQALFALGESAVSRDQVVDLLRKDDDPALKSCSDLECARFLDGLIVEKRGKQDGPKREPEKRLTNNIILRKLKIAMDMRDQDILDALDQVEFRLSKHELSAFFRKPGHKHFRECKDQVLRNFLMGLQIQHRGAEVKKSSFQWKSLDKKQ